MHAAASSWHRSDSPGPEAMFVVVFVPIELTHMQPNSLHKSPPNSPRSPPPPGPKAMLLGDPKGVSRRISPRVSRRVSFLGSYGDDTISYHVMLVYIIS